MVALDDLAHQREAQPDAAGALGVSRQTEEWLEDAFEIGLRHARAVVGDADLDAGGALVHEIDADLAAAVAARVLQQVAQRAPQQPLLAAHAGDRALDLVCDDRLQAVLSAMSPSELDEVGIVLRELEWRMSELERALQIRSEQFSPGDARRVYDLIDEARQPMLLASMAAAAA